MENKELIFAYSDYLHCNDINRPPYADGMYFRGCIRHAKHFAFLLGDLIMNSGHFIYWQI